MGRKFITQEEFINIMKEIAEYNKNLKDYSVANKAFEIAIRLALTGKKASIAQVCKQSVEDCKPLIHGERVKIEICSGCAEIDKTVSPVKKFVIYNPLVKRGDWHSHAAVFTHEEWIRFLNGYPGGGQLLKTSKTKEGRIKHNIQSFKSETRPRASGKLASYILGTCENQPSFREWAETI